MGKVIGIDLGTTYSEMAYVDIDLVPRIIRDAEGHEKTPSVVAWKETKDGGLDLLVGKSAKAQAVVNPEGTVSSIKRKMGTDEKVRIHGQEYTPEEISARILKKLKKGNISDEEAMEFYSYNIERVLPYTLKDGVGAPVILHDLDEG